MKMYRYSKPGESAFNMIGVDNQPVVTMYICVLRQRERERERERETDRQTDRETERETETETERERERCRNTKYITSCGDVFLIYANAVI